MLYAISHKPASNMPELPEIETLKRGLKPLVGKIIKSAKVTWPKMIRPHSAKDFEKILKRKSIVAIHRRAKVLILELSGDYFLLVHLKMTGQLVYCPGGVFSPPSLPPLNLPLVKGEKKYLGGEKTVVGGHPQKGGIKDLPNKFTHAIIDFTDGSKLYFNDQRKFGWLKLVDVAEKEKMLEGYGIEPLEGEFNLKKFKSILSRYPKRKIKQILLDQTLISGLGNIYVDESCFYAKILPTRIVGDLNEQEVKDLCSGIKKILRLAITKRGTSFSHYVNADAQPGGFVPYLKVYGRKGEKCKRCNGKIHRIKLNGRGTHFCDSCQK